MVYHADEMTWKELRRLSEGGALVVLPTGSLEQHGPHLPTKVDSLLVDRITSAAAAAAANIEIILLPTLWLGASDHHTPLFAASVTERTYISLIADLAASLAAGGVRRLAIVNGHGGNSAPLRVALTETRRRSPSLTVVAAEYWSLAAGEIRQGRSTPAGGMAHAGELETSLVHHLSPEDVRAELIAPALPEAPDELIPDLVSGGAAASSAPWRRFSANGAIGDPTRSSADAGKAFHEAIVAALAEFLQAASRFNSDGDSG
jgi:creatinine amidohydrolase